MRTVAFFALMLGAVFAIAHPNPGLSNTVSTSVRVTMNVPDSCSLSTPATPPPAGFTAGSFLGNCTQPNVNPILTVTSPGGTTFGQPVVTTLSTPPPAFSSSAPATGFANAASTPAPLAAATLAPDDSAGHVVQAVLVPGTADATGAVTVPAAGASAAPSPSKGSSTSPPAGQTPAPFDDSYVATINF